MQEFRYVGDQYPHELVHGETSDRVVIVENQYGALVQSFEIGHDELGEMLGSWQIGG